MAYDRDGFARVLLGKARQPSDHPRLHFYHEFAAGRPHHAANAVVPAPMLDAVQFFKTQSLPFADSNFSEILRLLNGQIAAA